MAFTFFFRDEPILRLAVEKLVPNILGRTNVRILNAGCAMGMETYTFVILLAEKLGKFALRNVKIHAIDIDSENVDFGKTVRDGIYSYENLKRVPSELFTKYFSQVDENENFKVIDELRNTVYFEKYDLLTLKPLRSDYSMVICKNVLLHFNQQQRIDVLKMYHSMLLNQGLLVMEHTQSMPKELNHKFKKIADNAQIFQKQ